jgi:hypothetical protein
MTQSSSRALWTQVACLTLWPLSLPAGVPDPAANLLACRQGRPSCDRSRLSLSELTEVARADHARNVADCRNGLVACDRSKLSREEATALAVAEHDRNVSRCTDGIGVCDASRLTVAEARDVAAAGRRQQVADCRDGLGICDNAALTGAERADVAAGARERMVSDCRDGVGTDHVTLTRVSGDWASTAEPLGLHERLGRLRPLEARPAGGDRGERRRARAQPGRVPGRRKRL